MKRQLLQILGGMCAFMLLSVSAFADVSGVVVDVETGKPLVSATVTVAESGLVLKTDDNGRFTVPNPGLIEVTHVGYTPVRDVRLVIDGDNEIKMSPTISVLNSMVVTANRYEKEAYKVSQPIAAMNEREIESKGHTIVSDVVREFPGVDMNDAGPFRARPVIRGLYGTRILVLVDGERLNDQRDIADFAGVSMSLVDPNEIHRVEVVNGPTSVLYGSDAMAGVVNIITKRNRFSDVITPTGRYSGRYSTVDEQHSNRIDLGVEGPFYSLSVGYQYREAENEYKLPDGWQDEDARYQVFSQGFYDSLNAAEGTDFSGDRMANTRARVNNLDLRGALKVTDKVRLDMDFGRFRAKDIGYPGVPNDSTPYFFFYPTHDRDNASATLTMSGLTSRLHKLEARLYYEKIAKDFFTDFYDNVTFSAGPYTGIPQTTLSTTEVKKFGLNFQELYSFHKDLHFTFGFDAWREEIDGRASSVTHFEPTFPGPPPFDEVEEGASVPKNTWDALGVYVSGEMNLGFADVNAGVRFDNFWINTEETEGYQINDSTPLPTEDEQYSRMNGSVGVVVPVGYGVNWVTNFATAYRVPNVVERFYYGSASGRQTRPNPDIKPEKGWTLDFGVKGIHDEINYTLMGFYSDYRDFTQLQNFNMGPMGPEWRYENIDDVTIFGFESMIEVQIESGLYGSMDVSYQHGQNNTDDIPVFVSPLKLGGAIGYRSGWHGLWGEVSARRVLGQDRIPDVATLDDISTQPFSVFNATVGATPMKNVRFAVSVKNVFDEVYAEPFNARNPDNPIPEPGRNFVFTVQAGI